MSIYMGEGSSGKKQIHLTNADEDLSIMQGPPAESTTFHSDLPYITVKEVIWGSDSTSDKQRVKDYMDQGYLFKRVQRSYIRGTHSSWPGATARFRTSTFDTNDARLFPAFSTLSEINPSRGYFLGVDDTGPSNWGPSKYVFQSFPGNENHFMIAVSEQTNNFDYIVGINGGYYSNEPDGQNEVNLRSGYPNRQAKGTATIRGTHKDYALVDQVQPRYDPWNGDYTSVYNTNVFLIMNVIRTETGFEYESQNPDPGVEGIHISKEDITIGSTYSMKNTPVLTDIAGSGGTLRWSSTWERYFLESVYIRSSNPLADSPIWDFFNEMYPVGTEYTRDMDEAVHIVHLHDIFVDDNNIIIGWEVRAEFNDTLINVNPAKLLSMQDGGVSLDNDTITMEGNGKSLIVASPTSDLLSLPGDPVTVLAALEVDLTYEEIRQDMSLISTYRDNNDTWANLGDPQNLYGKSEIVGVAPFPPSIKPEHDSVRVTLDHGWGSGRLGIKKGGYESYNDIDHRIQHSPFVPIHLFRDSEGLQPVGNIVPAYLCVYGG